MQRFHNKKGQRLPAEVIAGAVLVLASLFAILLVIYVIGPKFGFLGSEKACQLSISAKVQAGVAGEALPTACRLRDEKLKNSEPEALKQIAEMMASCSNQFLNGNYEDVLGGKFTFASPEQNNCFVCYRFKGEKNLDLKAYDDIRYYLVEQKYTQGQTYMQYITNKGRVVPLVFTDVNDPNTDYAIAFASKTGDSDLWKSLGGAAAVAAGGAAIFFSGGLLTPVVLGAAAVGGGATLALTNVEGLYRNHEKSVIYLDKFNNINDKCLVQS